MTRGVQVRHRGVRRAERGRHRLHHRAPTSASSTGSSAAASPCTPRCPTSGGLFEGSEVTYRGVKIGKVERDERRPRDGVELDLALEEGTELPDGLADVRAQPLGGGRAVPRLRAADDEGPVRRGRRHARGRRGVAARRRGATCSSSSTTSSARSTSENLQVVVERARARCSTTPARRCSSCSTTAATFVDEASAHTDETMAPARQRADRAPDPAGTEREHPLLLPRPAPLITRSLRGQRRGPARRCSRARPATAREVDALLDGPRADPAGAARQRGQRRPGGGLAPRRARAAAGDLPAHHRRRLHRHARRRLRPRQPAVRPTSVQPCTEGYLPPNAVAAAARPHRRARSSRPSAQPARRTPCAARSTRPDGRATRSPGARLPWRLRPGHRPGRRARSTRTATRCASSTRATCRSSEATRGSGCWSVRWLGGTGEAPRPPQHRSVRRGAAWPRRCCVRRRRCGCSTTTLAATSTAGQRAWSSRRGVRGRAGAVRRRRSAAGRARRPRRSSTSATTTRRPAIDAVSRGCHRRVPRAVRTATDGVIKLLEQNKSVMDGEVLWAGVVAVDQDSATVIAATTGTVANKPDRATSRWPATTGSSSTSSPRTASG